MTPTTNTTTKKPTQKRVKKTVSLDYSKLSIKEIKEKAEFYINELNKIQELIGELPSLKNQINNTLLKNNSSNVNLTREAFAVNTFSPIPNEPSFTREINSVAINTDIAMDGLKSTSLPIVFSPIEPEAIINEVIEDNSADLAANLTSLVNEK